jgi:hypothetical protein
LLVFFLDPADSTKSLNTSILLPDNFRCPVRRIP